MDLYKHAFRLTPMVCSDLVADCFELARDIRVLDMRAAPYDLADLGFEPVRIETRRARRSTSRRSAGSPSAARRCGRGWSRSASACSAGASQRHENCEFERAFLMTQGWSPRMNNGSGYFYFPGRIAPTQVDPGPAGTSRRTSTPDRPAIVWISKSLR